MRLQPREHQQQEAGGIPKPGGPTGGGDLSEGRHKEKGNSTSQRGWVVWATEVKKESEEGSEGADREGKGGRESHRVGTHSIISCLLVVPSSLIGSTSQSFRFSPIKQK